jgi:hypothetical protein
MNKVFTFLLFIMSISVVATAAITPAERQVIKKETIRWSKVFNVDPAFALAVFHIESRVGGQEFRKGRVGSKKSGGPFYAPANIHYSYLKDRGWPIDTLEGNVMVGVRALQGTGYSRESQIRRLRRYNASYNGAYGCQVMKAKAKYAIELSEGKRGR